jgi:hypothetical protein
MIFSAPSGHKYGYFDGWQPDGAFITLVWGQVGDQELKQGNRALSNTQTLDKRAVAAPECGEVTYVESSVDRPAVLQNGCPMSPARQCEVNVSASPVGDHKGDLLAADSLQENRSSVDEMSPRAATEHFTSSAITERVAERREAALITEYLISADHQHSRDCDVSRSSPSAKCSLYSRPL